MTQDDSKPARRRRITTETPGDDDLGGPAAFARVLGHADTSTVSHNLTAPPSGWPEPDDWQDLPSGRRRPLWRYGRMRAYASSQPDQPNRGRGGRRAGSRNNPPHAYAGDTRLTLARQLLADHPNATNTELIRQLSAQTPGATSHATWTKILTTAREHPKDT